MISKTNSSFCRRHILLAGSSALALIPFQAIASTGNNFTMLDGGGGNVGGTNDVEFTWDGTLNTDPATATSNATISSPALFFGQSWTAYDVKIYGPGTYTISTADSTSDSGCPFSGPTCVSGGDYNVTVGADQLMAHMKFAWGATQGIDVIDVYNIGKFGPSTMETTDGNTTTDPWSGDPNTVWTLMSTDWDNDGINGAGMVDGPFQGFNANFNLITATGGGSGGTTNPNTGNRTLTPPDIASPSFGGGAALGLWSLLGLLGLALTGWRRN